MPKQNTEIIPQNVHVEINRLANSAWTASDDGGGLTKTTIILGKGAWEGGGGESAWLHINPKAVLFNTV